MSKRRNKAEWQRLIDEQESCGLTQKAFCEQADIPVATFCYWKRKLKRVDPSPSDEGVTTQAVSLDDWIELPATATATASPSGWHIELDLGGGLCLRLSQG